MDSIASILGMSMIALGLLMLVGGVGALIYGVWLRYRGDRPGGEPGEAVVASGSSEVIGR